MPTTFNQKFVGHQKRKKQATLCDAFVVLHQIQATTDKSSEVFPQLQRQNRFNSFVANLSSKDT